MPKSQPLQQLDSVIASTVEHIHDYTKSPADFTRNRKLNPETLIKTTLNMQGNSLNAELYDIFPDIDKRMTASAYEQAKGKLSPQVFEDIFHQYNETMDGLKTLDLAKSYRVYAIDGCRFSVPYAKDSIYAIQRPGKPYAMVNANMMFDLMNRTYQDCVFQTISETDERSAAIDMIKRLDNSEPYIVIMDRGYSSFSMFETCNRIKNCHYIIRGKMLQIKDLKNLPDEECDLDIEFLLTTSARFFLTHRESNPHLHYIRLVSPRDKEKSSKNESSCCWDFGRFCKIKTRIVKLRINDPGSRKEQWEVLVTNLDRSEFPVSCMKEMYHMRWDIETSFRALKYDLGAINFHSKKPEFIQMELFSHFIMFNAVSRHINALSVPSAGHKDLYSIDFKMACKAVRRHYRMYCDEPPGDIYADMLSYINPVRPGRADKRTMRPKAAVRFAYRVA